MSSITSLQGSHAPSAASDEDESTYIQRTRILHWIRIGLCMVVFALAIASIGAEGHPLRYYNKTVRYEEMHLPLWPENLELRPTIALITCGIIISLQSLIYVVVALLPSPRSRIFFLNSLVTGMSIVGFIAALIPIGFNLVYSNPHTKNGTYWGETIHSWTCTWSFNGGKDSGDGTVVAVAGFARLCRETRASFALMCILLVLEFVLCVAAGAGWYLEVEMKKKREGIVSVAAAYAEEKPTDLFD